MPDLEDILTELASKPKSVTVDGVTVTNHSLPEVSAVADRVAAQTATSGGGNPAGVRFTKLVPPGAA